MEALRTQKETHCRDCGEVLLGCDECSQPCCTFCDGHMTRDPDGVPAYVVCGKCCTDVECRYARAHTEVAVLKTGPHIKELSGSFVALKLARSASEEAWKQNDGSPMALAVVDACAALERLVQARVVAALAAARDGFEARNVR